jgi:hypothetical protein
MYWIIENKEGVVYEDNSENQGFHEDEDVIDTKLSKEHQLGGSRKFLISLFLHK